MKKMIFSMCSAMVLALSSPIAMAADMKLGVVDLRQVLQKSAQMAALNKQLETQFKPREDKIKAAQKALQADEDKFKKEESTMSASDKSKLQDKIIAERTALQGLVATFQQDLGTAQNQGMQKLLTDAGAVIADLGKKDDYTLIVSKEAAFYSKDGMDMTAKVSEVLAAKPAEKK